MKPKSSFESLQDTVFKVYLYAILVLIAYGFTLNFIIFNIIPDTYLLYLNLFNIGLTLFWLILNGFLLGYFLYYGFKKEAVFLSFYYVAINLFNVYHIVNVLNGIHIVPDNVLFVVNTTLKLMELGIVIYLLRMMKK